MAAGESGDDEDQAGIKDYSKYLYGEQQGGRVQGGSGPAHHTHHQLLGIGGSGGGGGNGSGSGGKKKKKKRRHRYECNCVEKRKLLNRK